MGFKVELNGLKRGECGQRRVTGVKGDLSGVKGELTGVKRF